MRNIPQPEKNSLETAIFDGRKTEERYSLPVQSGDKLSLKRMTLFVGGEWISSLHEASELTKSY